MNLRMLAIPLFLFILATPGIQADEGMPEEIRALLERFNVDTDDANFEVMIDKENDGRTTVRIEITTGGNVHHNEGEHAEHEKEEDRDHDEEHEHDKHGHGKDRQDQGEDHGNQRADRRRSTKKNNCGNCANCRNNTATTIQGYALCSVEAKLSNGSSAS